MGCCGSSSVMKKLPLEWKAQFTALKIYDADVEKFFKIYRKIDTDNSGAVTIEEMMMYLDIEPTNFCRRIFAVFDMNNSGKVDFKEFVLSMWNYCSLSDATLDTFTFDLYDKDGSGNLTHTEVEKMLEDIYGKNFHSSPQAKGVLSEVRKIEKGGSFTLQKFAEFTRYHQNMLFPAFQLQLNLQTKVMGVKFWKKCSKRRIEISKGKYVSLVELMELNLQPELKEKLIQEGQNQKKTLAKGTVALQNTGPAHTRENHHHHHNNPGQRRDSQAQAQAQKVVPAN